jgi:hypothetical protein
VLDRSLSQAGFNHLVLRLGLQNEIASGTSMSVSRKADRLGRIVVQRPTDPVATTDGMLPLAETVVREAVTAMARDVLSRGSRRCPALADSAA